VKIKCVCDVNGQSLKHGNCNPPTYGPEFLVAVL